MLLALSSCIPFGDPTVSTDYIVTSGEVARVSDIVREVATRNGLRRDRPRDSQADSAVRSYSNWPGEHSISTWLTLDMRVRPLLISIGEQWTASRTSLHRKIARELEAQLTAAHIAFHRSVGDEYLRLLNARIRNET